jgi:hypothetical protein
MKTVLGAIVVLAVAGLATPGEAQVSCRPRHDGGYTCYDGRGNVTNSTPRYDGGYNVYDSRGNAWVVKPRPDGGATTHDGQGNTLTTTPRFGGGTTTFDGRGNSWTTVPDASGQSLYDPTGQARRCSAAPDGSVTCY